MAGHDNLMVVYRQIKKQQLKESKLFPDWDIMTFDEMFTGRVWKNIVIFEPGPKELGEYMSVKLHKQIQEQIRTRLKPGGQFLEIY